MNVIHPYGSLGPLGWQQTTGGVHFGKNLSGDSLEMIARNILTFNESIAAEVVSNLQDVISKAGLLMFLGFGYHEQNLKLLAGKTPQGSKIFGTAPGFSDFDKNNISEDLSSKFEVDARSIFLHSGNCSNIFDEYSRALRLVGF